MQKDKDEKEIKTLDEVRSGTVKSGIIPVWFHAICWVIVSFGSAYIGLACGKYMGSYLGLTGNVLELLGGICMLSAFIFPSSWFRKKIPARCSKCQGRTWCRFENAFFIYECESCGYVTNTKMGPGEA
jgi:ribosomal protein S27E